MAVADASFSTENDSTSSTFISFKSRSNPSTKTSAELLAPKVEIPRIQNSETLPGFPEVCIAKTPGTLPAKALEIAPEGFAFKISTSTLVMAPVTVSFFWAPVPVMTTSSIRLASDSCIVTLTTRCSFTNTSTLSKPTYENDNL